MPRVFATASTAGVESEAMSATSARAGIGTGGGKFAVEMKVASRPLNENTLWRARPLRSQVTAPRRSMAGVHRRCRPAFADMPATKRTKKKAAAAPAASRGLDARRVAGASPPGSVESLMQQIEADGGSVLATYRDPLGSHWQILAALPIDKVEPTPYQRDLSEAHVGKVAKAIDQLDRYLDPVIAVPSPDGKYWSPNGYHRLGAMRQLGARSIVAIVVPEAEVAHRILILNTEKAHNLRERALEVARLAEALVALDDRPERDYALEFEEPSLLTLGLCYLKNGRFAGASYQPVLKRTEE